VHLEVNAKWVYFPISRFPGLRQEASDESRQADKQMSKMSNVIVVEKYQTKASE